MLDRVAPAVQRPMQPDAAISMAGHFLSPAMGLVDNRLQLFDRERGLRHQFSVLTHPGTMGHVDLDPVRTVVELFPRRLSGLDGTVHDLCALRHVQLGSIAFQHVTARGRDGSRRDK